MLKIATAGYDRRDNPPRGVLPVKLSGESTISCLGKIASFPRDRRVTTRGVRSSRLPGETNSNWGLLPGCIAVWPTLYFETPLDWTKPAVFLLSSSMRGLRIPSALTSLSRSEPNIFAASRYTKISSLLTPTLHQRFLFHSIASRSSLPPLHLFTLAKTSILSANMADDKNRKQATLGYVRDSQLTIGCVDRRFAA